ncbi:MAG TPA: anti-sigma factor [Candidatus Acidoferrales bacterium]|nr:anti-sigma factor [Candidatus Acidoferrales bacterium]
MRDQWTDQLSEYVDGGLPPSGEQALERHLDECAECRVALAGLRAVKQRARVLVGPPAPDDLWAGIAERIGTAGSSSARGRLLELPRRRALSLRPLLAAAAATVVVAGAALWMARELPRRSTAQTSAAAPSTNAQTAAFDASRVESEIAQLQRALDRGRGKLDPHTIAVLEKNLGVIRQATEDARKALESDPANRDLQNYFAGTVQSKLDLMRRATALAGV